MSFIFETAINSSLVNDEGESSIGNLSISHIFSIAFVNASVDVRYVKLGGVYTLLGFAKAIAGWLPQGTYP